MWMGGMNISLSPPFLLSRSVLMQPSIGIRRIHLVDGVVEYGPPKNAL